MRRRSGRKQNGQSQCGAAFSSEKTRPLARRPPASPGRFLGHRVSEGGRRRERRRRAHHRERQDRQGLAEHRPRLWRQQVQSARSDQCRECRETGPRLVLPPGLDPRRRSDPDRCRRDDVCHGAVGDRLRDQRQDWRKDLDVRFPIASRQGVQAVLRCRQSWRRGLQRQGLCRDARRALDRPRRGDRQSALEC